jgi:hypothetical protein
MLYSVNYMADGQLQWLSSKMSDLAQEAQTL